MHCPGARRRSLGRQRVAKAASRVKGVDIARGGKSPVRRVPRPAGPPAVPDPGRRRQPGGGHGELAAAHGGRVHRRGAALCAAGPSLRRVSRRAQDALHDGVAVAAAQHRRRPGPLHRGLLAEQPVVGVVGIR